MTLIKIIRLHSCYTDLSQLYTMWLWFFLLFLISAPKSEIQGWEHSLTWQECSQFKYINIYDMFTDCENTDCTWSFTSVGSHLINLSYTRVSPACDNSCQAATTWHPCYSHKKSKTTAHHCCRGFTFWLAIELTAKVLFSEKLMWELHDFSLFNFNVTSLCFLCSQKENCPT